MAWYKLKKMLPPPPESCRSTAAFEYLVLYSIFIPFQTFIMLNSLEPSPKFSTMRTATAFVSFASLASAMCHYGTTLAPRRDLVRRDEGGFGYNELQGPLNWHGLSSDNELCALGTNQSPINIAPSEFDTVNGSSYSFEIDSYIEGAEFENLGTNVQVYVNGSATVGDKSYAVQQFHFHTPSEHRIGSEYFPLEVHFIMQAEGKCFLTDY